MNRYLQILKVSWFSSLVITVFFAVITLLVPLVSKDFSSNGANGSLYWNFVCILLIVALVFYADRYGKKQVKKLQSSDLLTKLKNYKSRYTKQMMCYALISIVCFVIMLLSRQIGSIIFDIFSFLLIFTHRPSALKVKFDLHLSQEELSKFNHIKFGTE